MNDIKSDILRVGLLLPYHGPIGLWALSSERCAQLAAAELNTYKGILDREIELIPIDASGEASSVANQTMSLVKTDGLEGISRLAHQRYPRRTREKIERSHSLRLYTDV